MKKKKTIISLLLCLTLFFTVTMPGMMANAVEGDSKNNGMVINKTATANNDGTYTIQLEAYATGNKVITEVTEDVPTDIVLVLDQSGSMENDIGTVSFSQYSTNQSTNRRHYERRHNGGSANLYHRLEDGSYASVSVTVQETVKYTKIENGRNNSTSNRYTNYWNNQNNLYALVDGAYKKVTVSREAPYWWSDYEYTYKLPDGTVIATSTGDTGVPSFSHTDDGALYLIGADENKTVYTYTYTDADGNTQTIGTSTGADTTFGTTLYQKVISTSGGGSRLNALKTAINTFADNVNDKAKGADGQYGTTDDINHRIAVVGFATGNKSSNGYPAYENTELFIGATQYNYNENASTHYGSAFQDMNTEEGYNNIIASKNALAARGATYPNCGVDMANGIFRENPVPQGERRNRVVIVFTDGIPGWSGYNGDVASNAITQGNNAKDTYQATVYTVGIFAGADATSAGNSNGSDTEKANWFMQNLSSNNGTVQDPSYYLSASDADTLNNIFQQISDNIESGGSSTTLSDETVIKDIISPAFSLPAGTTANDITLETYSCTGKTGDTYSWSKNTDAMGASAAVKGDQVSVTGFDFAANYVGTVTENGTTTYRGDKLVISFNVVSKAGFLGGNNVYTNTSAGVYENGSATEPVLTFERPQVNVPIGDVAVTAADKNVYLSGSVTAEQLRSGATVKVGDVELSLDEKNYGLESWQNEYVDIDVKITDKDGTVISADLSNLTDDQTYTVAVTVKPKENGSGASGAEATAKSDSAEANINVYKPELTFKDSTVYYGDTVPADFNDNLVSTVWKHGTTEARETEMGAAPELGLTCTADAAKIEDGIINTKQDINVDAVVKIGNTDITANTNFVHAECTTGNCGWNEAAPDGTPAFLLHPKTCELMIEKTGGKADETYIMNVKRNGQNYMTVSVNGNNRITVKELPVGNYTLEEDADWSWRYEAAVSGAAELSAANPDGTLICTNTKKKDNWLNEFSSVVKNVFVKSSSTTGKDGE